MDPKMMHKQAMSAVLEDMGRAAREGRTRRWSGKLKPKQDLIGPHGEHLGEHLQRPANAEPLTESGLSDQDVKDLEDLSVQH